MAFLGFATRLAIVAATVRTALSNAFRGTAQVQSQSMRLEVLRAAMLDELMVGLGHGNRVTQERLQSIEEALRPMFNSLPKNQHGNLEHTAVRYALHRLFVLRHGMFVKGLEPGGEAWDSASATDILDDRVPSYVQSLFESRLEGHGLGLHEVAILAATLEHLIHDEATDRLRTAYEVNNVALDQHCDGPKVRKVIDTYMVMFLLGVNSSQSSHAAIVEHRAAILRVYPSWPQSQKFTREVQREVVEAHANDEAFAPGRLTFNATAKIVEEIMERYGRWQDIECRDLKTALMQLEDKDTGRVLLKDFYGSAKGGAWQFTESVDYLRDLGALDESNAQRPGVLIANYVNSHSNCLASSGLYSICCLNECEPLLGHIEREIGAPDAPPERVLELVSALPSSTVQAPRELPAELAQLLEQVAGHHNGRVPLHGRLFSQWMHHAFPRECPFPHRVGTTKPMTANEWINERGSVPHASEMEMQLHIMSENTSHDIGSDNPSNTDSKQLLWTVEEELVVSTTAPPTRLISSWFHPIVAVGALVSMAWTLLMSWQPLSKLFGQRKANVLPFAGKAHYC
mmetsp:Transcript_89419/g.208206  ORF Transcript_89419/g.208206 Transcript_89419/m.208206 type:complete len:571 (+) Transcript_89419:94-1806(+)|eukprot:CAMPEP_0171106840 /NCGR_PEP_ID=MMETSP0766_2-20121228/65633_1 /TAXON_ID=439317 /ORGANISM="Gambierdiscus australes, Strain CAWD 149" /LENGTH=570 /DNA_ID=CAMNT_0011568035 /DNA_START=77 /DNA_END=1789 /DNA_ORIENTATION=-